ncbi:MAG: transcription factor TFIIB [Candidatus Nitrosopelagicus sp.]|nr:transcription factor TFIIB [Candidatus Nitrosopelagicus sp.]
MNKDSESNDHICKNSKCKDVLLVTDSTTGEVMCSSCGQVVSQNMAELGPESAQSGEDYMSKSRTGRKSTLAFNDMGLSTVIQQSDKDATGKNLSGEMKRTFYRLRMWDKNSKAMPGHRNMQKAFTLLEGLKAKLSLSDAAVEQAAYIYRKTLAKKIGRGRSIPVILSACVYASCRFTNTPRTIQDVADATNLRRTSIHRIYRMLVRDLDLTLETYNPVSFITRITTEVGASEKTKRDAIKFLIKAEELMITSGKNPVAMAATVVYLAAITNGEKVSQTQVSKAANISSVTIRNLCKKLKDAKISSFSNPKLTKVVKNDETFNVATRLKVKKD